MITDSLLLCNLRLLGISHSDYNIGQDAADELERLDAENATLRILLSQCATVLGTTQANTSLLADLQKHLGQGK